jgi:hypothetical protein
LTIASSLNYILWRYATINHRLVESDLDPIYIRLVARRYLIVIFMLMIAIVVSFENINASLLLYISTPLYNFILVKKHKSWFWFIRKK